MTREKKEWESREEGKITSCLGGNAREIAKLIAASFCSWLATEAIRRSKNENLNYSY